MAQKNKKRKKSRRKALHKTTGIVPGASYSADFRKRFEQASQYLLEGSLATAWPLCETLFLEKPDDFSVLKLMGYLRYYQRRLPEAIPLLERAYAMQPIDIEARKLMLAAYMEGNQYEKALPMAKKFLAHPLNVEENMLAFQALCSACAWEDVAAMQDAVIKQLIAANGTSPISDVLLLAFIGMNGVNPKDLLKMHKIIAPVQPPLLLGEFSAQHLTPTGRLKIAYLSPDFNNHPVAYFIYPVIAAHNRQQVEVWCYAHLEKQDGITDKIRTATDHFVDVSEMNHHDLARRIRADGIHILIDLAGHTSHSLMPTLAWRPAPVQISYLGYPNTTGMEAVDFHITDHDAEYDGEGGTRYTEKLLYMPESFICFGMRPSCPRRDNAPAEENGYITFGSFANARKMNPTDIEAWCRILNSVPKSRMVFKDRWRNDIIRDNILAEFARHGIDHERLIFLSSAASYDDHVAQYNMIDIALDTFPYTGTTTTGEALFMGVPVVTLVGKTHANRVSYSILKNVGFTETIAYSVDEYVDKAVKMASNPGGLSILRKTIPTLFEYSVVGRPERFVPQLEELYMDACKRKGVDLSQLGTVDEAVAQADMPQDDAPQDDALQPAAANPFAGLPGSSASRGLMVVEHMTDKVKCIMEGFTKPPEIPTWVVIVIPHGSEQADIAGIIGSIPAQAGKFTLMQLKTTAMDADTARALVSVCSQYITLEGQQGECEKIVREAAVKHGLPVIKCSGKHGGKTGLSSLAPDADVSHMGEAKPSLRLIHNLARSGGTLICKCLGCMEDIVLLSEIHPQACNRFDPVQQAKEWHHLLTDEDTLQLTQHPVDFPASIRLIEKRCRDQGKTLVVRDWAHLDFAAMPFLQTPTYRLQLADALANHFELTQLAIVRHPIDLWLSLQRLNIMAESIQSGRFGIDEFLHGYRRFAEQCKNFGFIRYENFTHKPKTVMQQLCKKLGISFDAEFIKKWPSYTTITGDITSTRGGGKITPLKRRGINKKVHSRFLDNQNYWILLDMLGYEENAPKPSSEIKATLQPAPLVSIILLGFNHELFIREAVRSVLNQDYRNPLEIILSDDASSDRTFEIMQEEASRYRGPHHVRLNRNENNSGGVVPHINKLMEMAEGQLILVAAGDDISLPYRTERTVETWNEGKGGSVFRVNPSMIDDKGNRIGRKFMTPEEESPRIISYQNMIRRGFAQAWCTAWDRRVFDLFGSLPCNTRNEDQLIPFRGALLNGYVFIPSDLIEYRTHQNNLSIWRRLELSKSDEEKDALRHESNDNMQQNRRNWYEALQFAHQCDKLDFEADDEFLLALQSMCEASDADAPSHSHDTETMEC